MGLFGSNYENSGVGISKNAPKKKGIFRFFELYFRKFWKLLEVNLLYSVFFIPVLLGAYAFLGVSNANVSTVMLAVCFIAFILVIGPATAGMFKILRNYTLEKHSFILTDFKKAFAENYKKSFVLGLIDTLIILSVSAAVYVYPQLAKAYDNKMIYIPFVICVSIAVVVMIMNFYAFLMIVATDISFKNIIKNSLALACVELKKSLLTFVITIIIIAVFVVAIMYNLSFLFLIPFIPAAHIAFIICFNCYPVVQKYVINPFYEQRGEVNPELQQTSDDEETIFEDKGGSEKPIKKSKKKNRNKKTIS